MALTRRNNRTIDGPVIGSFASGTVASTNLSAAYVNATSGNACGFVFMCEQDGTIDNVWVYTSAVTGTMATGIKVELRAIDSSGLPSTVASTSDTIIPAAGWTKFTFSSGNSISKGTAYWVVVSSSEATPASNFPAVVHTSAIDAYTSRLANFFRSATTTGGFATVTFATGGHPGLLMKCTYGGVSVYRGSPYNAAVANGPSNANPRGNIFTVDADCWCYGAMGDHFTALANTIQLRAYGSANGTLAASTVLASATFASTYASNNYQVISWAPVQLTAGTQYRIVMVPPSSANVLYSATIPGTTDSDILACRPWGGSVYGCESSDGTNWTDTAAKIFTIAALIAGQEPGTTGGYARRTLQ